jgi:hypothetical protein
MPEPQRGRQGVLFRAYGTTVGLHADDSAILARLLVRVSWLGWSPTDAAKVDVSYRLTRSFSSYELRCNGSPIHSSNDLAQSIDSFENHAKLLTAYRAQDRLFVHAGAVCWRGRGIIIPGRSRSGKTTLVKTLVEAGALYYSDEFAVLDKEGRLHPYTLPLSIRGGEGQAAIRMSVEAFGGRTGGNPVQVGLIAVTRYQPRARWQPRRLSPGAALLALMDNTIAARRTPKTAMAVLRQTVLGAKAVRTLRGDGRRVAAAVLAELDASA